MDIIQGYWKRIDLCLKEYSISLRALSEMTGIKYEAIKVWRSRGQIPNPNALVLFSNALNVSIDYLLKGTAKEIPDPVVTATMTNKSIRNIVQKCLDNPELVDAIEVLTSLPSASVSKEENQKRKAIG